MRRAHQAALLVLALSHALAGCGGDDGGPDPVPGGCAGDSRVDVFAAGLSKQGSQWTFQILSGTPAPPAKGDNEWVVQLLETGGAPLAGATLAVRAWMPDHGHGATRPATITPLDGTGQHRIASLNLWMPGYWEITLTATREGAQDRAVFSLCIEG